MGGWNRTTLPIGIDIGRSGVKLLQLRQDRHEMVVVAAARREYREVPTDEPEHRKKIIRDTVASALDSAPFVGRTCVCCPSTADLLIRAVRLPQMTDEELSRAVHWEAAERFGLPVEELEVEWVRAGEIAQGEDMRDEIILMGAKKAMISAHIDALIENRLRPIAVETPFIAAARCTTRSLRRTADQAVVRMFVDVGASGTTVSITRGQELAFLKPVEIGGDGLTRAVAERLDLDASSAAQLRIERMRRAEGEEVEGRSADEVISKAAFDAVRPLLIDLAQEAALCLRYYSVTFRGVRPDSVYIIGGNASEPELARTMSEHLKVECNPHNPLDGVTISGAEVGFDRRHAAMYEWGVAAGLSMRGSSMSTTHMKSPGRKPRPARNVAPPKETGETPVQDLKRGAA